ncbi:hypothetical protein GGI24_004514, partial [Coemansia furcata]
DPGFADLRRGALPPGAALHADMPGVPRGLCLRRHCARRPRLGPHLHALQASAVACVARYAAGPADPQAHPRVLRLRYALRRACLQPRLARLVRRWRPLPPPPVLRPHARRLPRQAALPPDPVLCRPPRRRQVRHAPGNYHCAHRHPARPPPRAHHAAVRRRRQLPVGVGSQVRQSLLAILLLPRI